MKTLPRWIATGLCILSLALPGHGQRAENEPFAEIKSVHLQGTNVVVQVEAAASFARITLESSTRVGRRAWEPRAVHHLDPGTAGPVTFTFTLPLSPELEILRVRGDLTTSLPAGFFEGATNFVSGSGGTPAAGGPFDNHGLSPTDQDFAGKGGV